MAMMLDHLVFDLADYRLVHELLLLFPLSNIGVDLVQV